MINILDYKILNRIKIKKNKKMKLISLGNLNKKFLLYLLAFIIIEISINLISLYINNNNNNNNNDNQICIPLRIIIQSSFMIIFIIPEILTKKKCSKEKKENKINAIIENKIVYIYKNPSKNKMSIIIIISLGFFYFILNSTLVFFQINSVEKI